MEPRCEDHFEFKERKEGIDDVSWPKVEAALRTSNPDAKSESAEESDSDKWMDMWMILFPPDMYPNDPVPEHPCKLYFAFIVYVADNIPSLC